MNNWNTASAYSYPLLIKNILQSPIAKNPEEEIVYRGTKRYTYAEFHERVKRLAAALVKMGVKHGDTVAVMDWDSNRYLECFFAVPMIGAVLHTINIRLSSEQLVYTIDHAEDDMLIINADFLPTIEHIKGRLDTVKKFVLINDSPETPASSIRFDGEFEQIISQAEPMESFPDFDENTRATTFYTTGTTGMPKGVFFTHRQLVLHTITVCATLASPASQGRFHREDVYMPITPMFHVHAWGVPYIATMLGVKQVYPGKYSTEILIKLIKDEKVTFSHCVPTILHMILKDPDSANVDFSKWKVIIGGAAMPKALCTEALKRGMDIFTGYGMSETCPILTIAHLKKEELDLDIEEQTAARCRTGYPIGLVDVNVVNGAKERIDANDRSSGEITVRAPWLTQGYLKDNINSEKLWEGGWLHTNDVACVNEKGSVKITDRIKDIVKVGGEWLSSLEIEDIIAGHPSVSEVAVIGQTDPKWGETPLAIVVAKNGQTISEKDIMLRVKGYIEKGQLPREAITLKIKTVDSLDKTSVGKTNKMALREKYTQQQK